MSYPLLNVKATRSDYQTPKTTHCPSAPPMLQKDIAEKTTKRRHVKTHHFRKRVNHCT